MKRCPGCKVPYEDDLQNCPVCGRFLEPVYSNTPEVKTEVTTTFSPTELRPQSDTLSRAEQQMPQTYNEVISAQRPQQPAAARPTGHFSGVVSAVHTTFEPPIGLLRALLTGRPYCFGQRLEIVVFRVQENNLTRFADTEVPLVAYGYSGIQQGDEVEVDARRRGGQWVVRRLQNHAFSSGAYFRQRQISAGALQGSVLLIVAAILALVLFLTSSGGKTFLAGIGSAAQNVILSVLAIGLILWILWGLLRGFFRGR